MLASILTFLGGGAFRSITRSLTEAYELKLKAKNDAQRLELEESISFLQAQQSILLAEQGRAMTSWIRPAFAAIAIVFWAKLILWDTVLQWGSTPFPGDYVMWFATIIPSAYFLVRPFEKRWRTFN